MNASMQSQYRNYQQTTQRSPHTVSSRRGPGPMVAGPHAQATPNNAQIMAQREAAARESELAKRRARKPTDKNVPEGVEDIIIGEGVQQYKDLREIERRLDATMMRKRLDIQESRPQNHERTKTLRLWISNTAENQPWQGRGLEEDAFDFSTGVVATYRVKIEGKLLDDNDPDDASDSGSEDEDDLDDESAEKDNDAMDHDGEETPKKSSKISPAFPHKKLSHFFKSITVDLDRARNLQPDNTIQIEWKKLPIPPNSSNLPANADFDCLEFERKSDENINCTISLYRDETPERFQLSRELADVLDTEEGTRAGVVMGIWEYVKAMNLQQDEEKRMIQCDDSLRAVFKTDTIFFPRVPELIIPHMGTLPPLKLPYTIRVDPEYHSAPMPTIYDIQVSTDDPLRAQMLAMLQNPSYPATLRQISGLDDQLALIVQAISHSKAKHAFFTSMSKDPVTFVRRWTSSQKRDLEVILGEATRGGGEDGMGEEFRRGGKDGVWGTENVRESVGLMVAAGEKRR